MAQQQLGQQTGAVDDGCQSRGIVHRAPLHARLGHSVNSVNATAVGRKAVMGSLVRLGTVIRSETFMRWVEIVAIILIIARMLLGLWWVMSTGWFGGPAW